MIWWLILWFCEIPDVVLRLDPFLAHRVVLPAELSHQTLVPSMPAQNGEWQDHSWFRLCSRKPSTVNGHWTHAVKHPVSACRACSAYLEGLFSHLSVLVCVGWKAAPAGPCCVYVCWAERGSLPLFPLTLPLGKIPFLPLHCLHCTSSLHCSHYW